MVTSKPIRILKHLSAVEMRQLGEFLDAHFHLRNNDAVRMFHILAKAWPAFHKNTADRELIWKKLYPDKPFKMARLRYVMSDLTHAIEDFLVWQQLSADSGMRASYLLQGYLEHDLDKYFQNKLLLTRKAQEDDPIKDSRSFLRKYQLEEKVYQYATKNNNRAIGNTLEEAVRELDIFYISTKLKYCCELINRAHILSTEFNIDLLDEILAFLAKDNYDDIPAIRIYHQILLTLTESENETHYRDLKTEVRRSLETFTKDELRDIYAFSLNYCIRKVNSGKLEYLNELFEVYQRLLEKELLFEGKYISHANYKNIVHTGLRIGEYEWVHEFIEHYQSKLPPEIRQNAYTYNLASYYFFTQDYDRSMQLLNQVEFTDVFYAVDSRALLLKIYFELNEDEPLHSLIESFKVFLKRNKEISDSHKESNLNLIKFVAKLRNLAPYDKEKKQKLIDTFNNTKRVADRSWLRSKLGIG